MRLRLFVFLFLTILAKQAIADGPFLNNGDGTVTDKETGLMWQTETTWLDHGPCSEYCKELTLAGHTDWQSPDVEQVRQLYTKKENFPFKLKGEHWVGKAVPSSFGSRWLDQFYNVSFNFGDGTESRATCNSTTTKKLDASAWRENTIAVGFP